MKEPMNEALWQQLTQDVMTATRDWRAHLPRPPRGH
jgi:FPC/CPF motif-containing protein YcgG